MDPSEWMRVMDLSEWMRVVAVPPHGLPERDDGCKHRDCYRIIDSQTSDELEHAQMPNGLLGVRWLKARAERWADTLAHSVEVRWTDGSEDGYEYVRETVLPGPTIETLAMVLEGMLSVPLIHDNYVAIRPATTSELAKDRATKDGFITAKVSKFLMDEQRELLIKEMERQEDRDQD